MTAEQVEATSVQLTRIEGVLNLIAYQVKDVLATVDRHETRIGALELQSQELALGAEARDKTVEATAKALREAKETQDALSAAEITKSNRSWSPLERAAAAATALYAVFSAYQQVRN